jgi:hypothetical protein
MSKVTCNLSSSADGYSAGHNQTEKRHSATTAATAGATGCTPSKEIRGAVSDRGTGVRSRVRGRPRGAPGKVEPRS